MKVEKAVFASFFLLWQKRMRNDETILSDHEFQQFYGKAIPNAVSNDWKFKLITSDSERFNFYLLLSWSRGIIEKFMLKILSLAFIYRFISRN